MNLNFCGYELLVIAPVAVLFMTPAGAPSWMLMWLLAFSIFCGLKWLTWRRCTYKKAPVWLQLGYLIAWPGMDADRFLNRSTFQAVDRPRWKEWLAGFGNTLFGAFLFWGVGHRVGANFQFVQAWIGMAGIVFMLHFGTFRLLSCAWRSIGVSARPLMLCPIASTSLSEFWGKRWNTAFRDLTHKQWVRPLMRVAPAWLAILVVFFISGIVHDVVISFPVGRGWGGPTLYFSIQASAMLVERSHLGRRLGIGRGVRGWGFALLILGLPAFLLFHSAFLSDVVLPFMKELGAL